MLYHVSRNGQMYGPYTLDDLRRYLASGNVLPTDLAKCDAMPEWMPVQQLLGGFAASDQPAAPAYGAVPPGYPPAHAYPLTNPNAYPDPPDLGWGLVLLFNVLSCGLFLVVWNIVVSAWMRRVQPSSQAMFYYIVGAVLSISTSGSVFALRHHHTFNRHPPLAGFIFIAAWVVRLIARFSMKADLERHFNGPEPLGLRLNGVMTFFFGGLYHQYHLNRITQIKAAARYRGGLL